jgi:Kdo2-lipid IVA lauroyltransferase/acyltransferase
MDIAKKTEYYLFKGIALFVQALSLGALQKLARGIAWAVFFVLRIRRTLTVGQIQRALPEKTHREVISIAYGSYKNLVTTILELVWSPNITSETCRKYVSHKNLEVLLRAYERGSGVILLCGHFGNWEWLGGSLPLELGLPVAAIARPMANEYVDGFVTSIREGAGMKMIYAHRAVRETLGFLRSGGIVFILADQSAPRDSYFVPFLGIPASTYAGPAHFALKTGAAVIIAYSLRQENGLYVNEYEEIPTADLLGSGEEGLRTLTLRHVQALERAIRRHPEHWLWQHKRWKHAPVEQQSDTPEHPSQP